MKNRRWRRGLAGALLMLLCAASASAQLLPTRLEKMRQTRNSNQIFEQWKAQMGRIEKMILEGKSKKALKSGTQLASEMVSMISSGETGQILGVVNVLRALAAYNLGDQQQALWHWQTGLQMFPDLANHDLSRFGDAYEFLRKNPPRTEQEAAPAGVLGENIQDLGLDGELTPPVKKHAPLPMFPPAKRGSDPLQVVVSAIIDEDGRPTSPRIVQADGEFSLVCASLEAFWKWEFEPAKLDGEPVPVFYNLAINFRTR